MTDFQSLYDNCKLQAQIWKQEARTANDTIGQIYQLCTGSTGEPGNWNGAEPVRQLVAERDRLKKALEKVRGYNVSIIAEQINYRPHDHIQIIDEALAATPAQSSKGE